MVGRAYDTVGKPAIALAARIALRGSLPSNADTFKADTLIRFALEFGGASVQDVHNALPHRAFLRLQRWQRSSAIRKPQGEALRLEAESIMRAERERQEAEQAAAEAERERQEAEQAAAEAEQAARATNGSEEDSARFERVREVLCAIPGAPELAMSSIVKGCADAKIDPAEALRKAARFCISAALAGDRIPGNPEHADNAAALMALADRLDTEGSIAR